MSGCAWSHCRRRAGACHDRLHADRQPWRGVADIARDEHRASADAGTSFHVTTPWGRGAGRRRSWSAASMQQSARRARRAARQRACRSRRPSTRSARCSRCRAACSSSAATMRRWWWSTMRTRRMRWRRRWPRCVRWRTSAAAQLWCVFGCGGDRDPGKRPQMGAIAALRRPRRRHQRQSAQRRSGSHHRADRRRHGQPRSRQSAIPRSKTAPPRSCRRSSTRAGDVVLLAGKGHETYQEITGVQAAVLRCRPRARWRWRRVPR